MHCMHVLGSEEAYLRFPEKEERLQDLLHMFLPLILGFLHPFGAVQGAFYPTFLGTSVQSLFIPSTLACTYNECRLSVSAAAELGAFKDQQHFQLS